MPKSFCWWSFKVGDFGSLSAISGQGLGALDWNTNERGRGKRENMFLKIARNLFYMHPSINDASCVCLIGGVGGGQLEGFRAHRTMHCFLKLQEPRYEMGPIPMTLDMPNTLQLAACQEVILARSQFCGGSFFKVPESPGVPFLSPFYLVSFPQLPKQPTIGGSGDKPRKQTRYLAQIRRGGNWSLSYLSLVIFNLIFVSLIISDLVGRGLALVAPSFTFSFTFWQWCILSHCVRATHYNVSLLKCILYMTHQAYQYFCTPHKSLICLHCSGKCIYKTTELDAKDHSRCNWSLNVIRQSWGALV